MSASMLTKFNLTGIHYSQLISILRRAILINDSATHVEFRCRVLVNFWGSCLALEFTHQNRNHFWSKKAQKCLLSNEGISVIANIV